VLGVLRSPVRSPATQSWVVQHRWLDGGGTSSGDAEGGWACSSGTFLPHIRLPLQGTSLGLCEPPLGTSSSSRAARLEDLAVSLVGI
jgi:hypothetical protein